MPATSGYTFGTRMTGPISANRPTVEAALKAEGFGILTEIDMQATLHAKLGVDLPPYLILGACNPSLAHRALTEDPSVGALLPCNVVLREEAGETLVEAINPHAAFSIVDRPAVQPVADEARDRLTRAMRALGASA